MSEPPTEGVSVDPDTCCGRHRALVLSGVIEIELAEGFEFDGCPLCAYLKTGPLAGLPEEAGATVEATILTAIGQPRLGATMFAEAARMAAHRYVGAFTAAMNKDDDGESEP